VIQDRSDNFMRAFAFTVRPDIEGGLSLDHDDKGNWTGGEVGKGELLGTKYGVSAASYPTLDIPNLSIRDVQELYRRDFWRKAGCDRLPPRVAVAVFDMAVNHGVSNAVKMLQEVVGTEKDGITGVKTEAAAKSREQDDLIVDLLRVRLDFYRGLKTFQRYGKGWQRRVLKLAMECAR
jgi:lysozyme family protein